MKIVVYRDEDDERPKRKIARHLMNDFERWHSIGIIGESYEHLATFAEVYLRGLNISRDEIPDIARDAALEAWKHLANRHHSDEMHLYAEMFTCLRQRVNKLVKKLKLCKTLRQELSQVAESSLDDGGISEVTLKLDIQFKLNKTLAGFAIDLALDCFRKHMLTIREIEEYAGFSNGQARGIRTIIINTVEDSCAIS